MDSLERQADTQTLIGTSRRHLVDKDTGELITVDQIVKRVHGTKQFWKVYLLDFLTVLGIFDSKQVDIFVYIVEHTNPATNQFIGTYKKIAEDVHCCEATIAKIMKKLQQNRFIFKVQNGVWLVNPDILMKGNDSKRQMLLTYVQDYENTTSINRSKSKVLGVQPESQMIEIQSESKMIGMKEAHHEQANTD